jgi:hypothetical protein
MALRYAILFVVILLVLQFIFGFRALRANSSDIRKVVNSQSKTLDNQSKIIANLAQAVKDLKSDNSRQTDYIQCLLSLNGHPVTNQCVKNATPVLAPKTSPSQPAPVQQAPVAPTKPAPKPAPKKQKTNLVTKVDDFIWRVL